MAYIGQDPVIGRYIIVDQISGGFNGTASGFTLAAGGQGVIPGLAQNVLLSLGGVIQQPGTDYTVSGSGITFTTPPLSGTTFFATVLGDVQAVGTPSDGTVLPASIATSGTFVFPNITTTGTTLIASGNASTPSLAVIGDTNTGLYSPGADQLSITTGGTERFRIDSAGQLEAVSLGTAAAPTFSFTTDPNTGIYSPGADQVAISTNGLGRLYVDASGRILAGTASSSIGGSGSIVLQGSAGPGVVRAAFGGTSPGSTDILGAITFTDSSHTGAAYIYGSRDGGTWTSTTSQPSAITFGTTPNGSGTAFERLRITSAGLVGVGSSSPEGQLHVEGGQTYMNRSGAGNQQVLQLNNSDTTAGTQIVKLAFGSSGATKASINAAVYGNDYLAFNTGSDTERMRLTGTGLGIGTSSPSELLNVATSSVSDTTLIRLDGGSGVRQRFFPSSGTAKFNWQIAAQTNVDNGFEITPSSTSGGSTFSTPAVLVKSDGKVGIGTSAPGNTLHVNSGNIGLGKYSDQAAATRFVGITGTSGFESVFAAGLGITTTVANQSQDVFLQSHNYGVGYNSLILKADGKVGIGTTSPSTRLSVIAGSANGIELGQDSDQSTDSSRLFFSTSAGSNAIHSSSGNLRFFTGSTAGTSTGTERMRLDSTGRLGIGTASPAEAFTLGSGNAQITSGQLTVGVTSTSGLQFINNGTFGTLDSIPLILRTASTERARIGANGSVQIGSGSQLATEIFRVTSGNSWAAAIEANRNISGDRNLYLTLGTNCNNTSSYFIDCTTATVGPKFYVYGNGTYGTVSDANLKKNIETARDGYLDDIQKLRVVKYNWKTDDDGAPKELGWIAQELAEVFPGLVKDSQPDADGNTVKEVKTSVLQFMLLKALQEANTKIETLEARLTAAGIE
jgi:hypothetical protein